ncbi:MAG: hypothetical protein ACYDGN_09620 [Acidimicrobiales bacterium]
MTHVMLGFALTMAWALYLGGSVAMELIWRPVQRYLPPGQVNVVCQKMGRRYRWIALGSLAVAGFALVPALWHSDFLSSAYGRTAWADLGCWALAVVGVTTMALSAHPALHRRHGASLSSEEQTAARERTRRAIRRMDVLLRADIAIALVAALLAASLPLGGLL